MMAIFYKNKNTPVPLPTVQGQTSSFDIRTTTSHIIPNEEHLIQYRIGVLFIPKKEVDYGYSKEIKIGKLESAYI